MPNRIIKESIRTSKSVNALSDFQFRVWLYLITYVDDYGRGSADPEILKGFVFPRRKGVTEAQISKALSDLANTGMIRLYEVDGDSYLCFPNWSDHQRIQAKKKKFPEPEESTASHRESPCVTVSHRESPPESESESESNPNPKDSSEPSPEPVILLPLNSGEYPILPKTAEEFAGLYPAVDVMQELRKMRAWLIANPTKRKTKAGIMRFVNLWLSKEQDKGGGKKQEPKGFGESTLSDKIITKLMEG